MNKIKKIFLILSLLVASWTISKLYAIEIEAGLGVTQQYPWGNFGYKGVSLDVKNNLNYDKLNTFNGRVRIKPPLFIPNVYITANPMTFDGRGIKNVNFVFGNKTFTGNIPFDSSVKLDHYDFALFYGIPFLETATRKKLNIDFGLNLRLFDFKGEIGQSATGIKESKSLLIPVPMGFFAFQIKPTKRFHIDSELKLISYGSNHYLDVSGRMKYIFYKIIFVSGGYKYQTLVIDQNDVKTDLRFGGPVAELGIDF